MTDARFEDAAPSRPLRLLAETPDDLAVIAAVLQDAVGTVAETAWMPGRRRFVAVLNRFRWEAARGTSQSAERVRTGLTVENVQRVRATGIDPAARGRVFNLLDLAFVPGEDGTGILRAVLSGGAEIALDIEALDIALGDITRPWPARGVPRHED